MEDKQSADFVSNLLVVPYQKSNKLLVMMTL